MAGQLLRVVGYTLVPVAAALVGGVVAVVRPPGPRARSYVQHFAAGVVFAAVAAEVLPDVHDRAPAVVVAGFAIGVATMLVVQRVGEELGGHGSDAAAGGVLGLLVTVAIDLFIDGFLVGAAFAVGTSEGFVVTVALTLEVLFLGLSIVAAMADDAATARKLGTVAGVGLVLLAGAVVGTLFLGVVPRWGLTAVLAFGAASLLYLVTEELLVEAHEVPQSLGGVTAFFLGFIVLFVLDML
ncbi:MAG: ZIP family metal transporter [Haloarculaceae archaeon]